MHLVQSRVLLHIQFPSTQTTKLSIEKHTVFFVSRALLKLPIKSQLQSLQKILDNGLINTSAEVYLASCIVKTAELMLVSFAGSIFLRPLALVAIAAPVAAYFDARKKIEQVCVKFRTKIELELPQFISFILVDISSEMWFDYSQLFTLCST